MNYHRYCNPQFASVKSCCVVQSNSTVTYLATQETSMSNLEQVAKLLETKWRKGRIELSTKHERIVQRLLAALRHSDQTERNLHEISRCSAEDWAAAKEEILASGKAVFDRKVFRLVQR